MKIFSLLLVLVLLASNLEAQALFGKKKEPKKEEPVKVETKPEAEKTEKLVEEAKKLVEESKKLIETKPVAVKKIEAAPTPVPEKIEPDEARKNALSDTFDSIEEDDWDEAMKSIQDYKAYMEAEKAKFPKEDLDEYIAIAYVFEKYVEGGLLMDGDDSEPPLDKAKNSYVLAQKKVNELEKQTDDDFILVYIEEMQYLIEDEIDYIQEVKESLVKK